jgi:hypothetical protein
MCASGAQDRKGCECVGPRWLPRLVVISFLVLGSFGTAEAATYYVDFTSGSDANSGTSSAAPWKTLSKVNGTTFQPGDVVNFKRGSVWNGNLQVRSSGTSSSPITYQAYGSGAAPQIRNPGVSYGESITITGDWNTVQDFLLTDAHEAGIDIAVGADHNTVRNNEMTKTGTGVMTRGQYNLITRNHAHDLTIIVNTPGGSEDYGAVCFWFYAGNNELSYNRGINCRAPSYDFGYDGGFTEVFNQGDNLYIHHNYAENTPGFFELGAGSSGGSAQNVTVAYNVLNNTESAVCLHLTGTFSINASNFKFENNTFYQAATNGYRVLNCLSNYSVIQLRNNIFYSNVQIANNGNFTHSNNLYHMVNMVSGSGVGYSLGPGEKTGNPLFVNVESKDFHLQALSPAIDAGIHLGHTKDHADGPVPAGAAPDMGAYEYGPQIPSAPTNLRVISP